VRPRRKRSVLRTAALSVALMGAPQAHPLHTTLTEVAYETNSPSISITIRGFADDLLAGASRSSGREAAGLPPARQDSVIARYLETRFSIVDGSGRPILLIWRGTRWSADVLWFSFRADSPRGLEGARVSNTALCDLHDDQVNIVQFKEGGSTRSLLFTRGDGMKRVP
jgi:hypothetical protein